jgi:hypothetical protein
MKMLEVCGTHDEGLHFKCTINHFFVMLWATFGGATASLTVFRSLTYIACCSPDFDQEFPVPGQFRSCGPVVGTLARGGSKMWGRRNSISVACDRRSQRGGGGPAATRHSHGTCMPLAGPLSASGGDALQQRRWRKLKRRSNALDFRIGGSE